MAGNKKGMDERPSIPVFPAESEQLEMSGVAINKASPFWGGYFVSLLNDLF